MGWREELAKKLEEAFPAQDQASTRAKIHKAWSNFYNTHALAGERILKNAKGVILSQTPIWREASSRKRKKIEPTAKKQYCPKHGRKDRCHIRGYP